MPDTVDQPPDAFGRYRVVVATRGEDEYWLIGDVVGEEDDEIEGRAVGPVEVFEYQQQWRRCGPFDEQREERLEQARLRRNWAGLDVPSSVERPDRLYERLIWQLRTVELDRVPDEDLESGVAGAPCQLDTEPALADARLAGHEDRRSRPRHSPGQCPFQLVQLAVTSDQDFADAGLHLIQYCAPRRAGRRAYVSRAVRIRSRRARGTARFPMRPTRVRDDNASKPRARR